MQKKDYYLVLGVSRHESLAGIRAAYRQLVRRYHPDRVGQRGQNIFQQLVEAYRVLSDAERRASYDCGLQHADDESTPHEATSSQIVPRARPAPEPLVPDRLSVMNDFVVTRPSFDEVFERFMSNFVDFPSRQDRRLDALRLQVIISPQQAARGGTLTLGVPVFHPCGHCQGAGRLGHFTCGHCGGRGLGEEEESVRLYIPPMVRDGAIFQLPLQGLGIHNMYLSLRVRIGR